MNESLFEIEGTDEYLYLYAGFDVEKFTVTFNFGNGIPSEEVDVEYNTPISEVVPETRNSEGKAVLSWSKTSSGDQIFTGNITDDTVLYAVEWAPVIELDLNGGEGADAVIARERAPVALPTPVRENYKFLHWETMSGEEANITSMPAGGAQLKAVWQAMLVFDENGGTEVKDISQEAGTAITLPTPEKEGFIFAGWYTADEEKYESKSMPAASVDLKAGWYETKEMQKVFIDSTESLKLNLLEWFSPRQKTYEINLNTILGIEEFKNITPLIHVDINFSSKSDVDDTYKSYVKVFLTKTVDINSASLYMQEDFLSGGSSAWQKREIETDITLYNGVFFITFQANEENGGEPNRNMYISDFYITLHYPDTSNLYL